MRLAALISLFLAGGAQALELEIPVDCEIGGDCFIQYYPDRDPGPGSTDYTCSTLAYDGHKGTDFRVATFSEIRAGVDILAAAPGVVKGTRNAEPDAGKDGMTLGRDCGNGLVIDHGGGWVTQYCHLAKGSIAVATGTRVKTGDRLGKMGFSGRTEFPHLHFSVRKNNEPFDPFDARTNAESCALSDDNGLWSEAARAQLIYQPGGTIDAGFAPDIPKRSDVQLGSLFGKPDGTSPIIAFWARFYGMQAGDILRLELQRPGGAVFAQKDVEIPRTRAVHFQYIGGRKPQQGWPKGVYRGSAALVRNGQVIDRIDAETTVK